MSHAFDTIDREKVLNVLKSVVCETNHLEQGFAASWQELRTHFS